MSLEDKLYKKHWYALHTKSHHEKKVASLLEGKGVDLFLPVRRLQRKWKDRKKMVDFPLFPGYIFVNIPLTEKKIVIQTPSVVKLVGTKEPEPLPASQIISVQKFVEEEIEFDPYPYLIPGVSAIMNFRFSVEK